MTNQSRSDEYLDVSRTLKKLKQGHLPDKVEIFIEDGVVWCDYFVMPEEVYNAIMEARDDESIPF